MLGSDGTEEKGQEVERARRSRWPSRSRLAFLGLVVLASVCGVVVLLRGCAQTEQATVVPGEASTDTARQTSLREEETRSVQVVEEPWLVTEERWLKKEMQWTVPEDDWLDRHRTKTVDEWLAYVTAREEERREREGLPFSRAELQAAKWDYWGDDEELREWLDRQKELYRRVGLWNERFDLWIEQGGDGEKVAAWGREIRRRL